MQAMPSLAQYFYYNWFISAYEKQHVQLPQLCLVSVFRFTVFMHWSELRMYSYDCCSCAHMVWVVLCSCVLVLYLVPLVVYEWSICRLSSTSLYISPWSVTGLWILKKSRSCKKYAIIVYLAFYCPATALLQHRWPTEWSDKNHSKAVTWTPHCHKCSLYL